MGIIFSSKKGGKRTCDTVLIWISLMQTFYIKCPTSSISSRFLHQQVGFVIFGGSEVLLFDKFTIMWN